MIISEDMNQRWYDLCPGALDAHQPASGKRKLTLYGNEIQPRNLAVDANVSVDSFYGSVNTSDDASLYPILNQVELAWKPGRQPGVIDLRFATFTPNFTGFRWRIDQAEWQVGIDTVYCWQLHPGANVFEMQALNSAGHEGKPSRLSLEYSGSTAESWPEGFKVLEEDAGKATPGPIRFEWEDFCHPRLQALRQRYELDERIANASSDLERVIRVRDWVKSRWDHSQPITSPPWDALYMLDRIDRQIEAYYCVHYSVVFMQCCLALGIPARLINLGRGICEPNRPRGYGRELDPDHPSDEHVVNEVWIDDLGKWVMMDVDFDIHYSHQGVPLNSLEIHQALLENRLDELVVCEGPLAYKLRANDRFYQYQLTVYYTHFSVFWRNNHLSDLEGPTRVLHFVDEKTPPMLWWEGSDLRHRPQIIGPVGISWPFELKTPRLNDENLATCWASSEEPADHWVELTWKEPVSFNLVIVDWPECWRQYWTSRGYRLETWQDGSWQKIVVVTGQPETAVSRHPVDRIATTRLRLVQPAGEGPGRFPNRLWLSQIEIYELP